MKNFKNLFLIALVAISALFLTSCGGDEAEDPTPQKPGQGQQETSLQKVTATLAGTWTFKSVTVTEIASSKTAKTSTCEKAELDAIKFTNTKWQNITPEPNFTYVSKTSVNYTTPCVNGSPSATLSLTTKENADGTVSIVLSNGRTFNVKPADISPNLIKASLENGDGYTVVYEFTK